MILLRRYWKYCVLTTVVACTPPGDESANFEYSTSGIVSAVNECQSTVINVADYGADPEPGPNDDTVAINTALADALACDAALFFPAGTWDLSQTLSVDGGIEIYGVGHSSVLRFFDDTASTDTALLIGDAAATVGVHIHDLALENNGSWNIGISAASSLNLRLIGLQIKDFDTQIAIDKDYKSHIANNRLMGGNIGISIGGAFSIGSLIEDNWMRGWSNVGIQLQDGPLSFHASANTVIQRNIVDQGGTAGSCTSFDIANYGGLLPTCPVAIQIMGNTLNTMVRSNFMEEIHGGIGIYVQSGANIASAVLNEIHGNSDAHYGIYHLGIGDSAIIQSNTITGTFQTATINEFVDSGFSTVIAQRDNNGTLKHVLPGDTHVSGRLMVSGTIRNVTANDFGSATVLAIAEDWNIVEAMWTSQVPVFGIASGPAIGREITFVFQDCNATLYGRFDGGNSVTPFRLKESSEGFWGRWSPRPYDSITFVKMNGIPSLEQTADPALSSSTAHQDVWVEVSRRELGMPCP